MIRKQHGRFIRNSFLAVCGILVVIFLITAVMMVRFVDTSIENEMCSSTRGRRPSRERMIRSSSL